jgi:hypothetical protein
MKISHHTKPLTLVLAVLLGINASTQAAVVLNANVLFNASTSLYNYSYSITNNEPPDLILVTIPASNLSAVTDISPPTGFSLTYDRVGQVLSFFEDNDIFTEQTFAPGSTVTPFTFSSPLAPQSVAFTAFDVSGNEFSGTTVAPVPETSTTLLGGLALSTSLLRRRRTSAI